MILDLAINYNKSNGDNLQKLDNPFRKAGIILIVVGIIDICIMVYCIANDIAYSSSFNTFAVITGILLITGSEITARVVRWFSAFMVIAFIGMLFLSPIFIPIQLLITQTKLNPVGMLGSFAFSFMLIGILAWVYVQLSTPSALHKLRWAGYKTGKPKSALYVALGLIVLASAIFSFQLNGESAVKAKALVKEQLGNNMNIT